MGEPEIMDLFPDSGGREGHADEISDEGYHYAGRSRINDYKHSSNNIHRQSEPYNQDRYQEGYQDRSPYQDRNPQKKSYINVNDERIVWAGAIFVFFGVFIFLIGYWLGKTTLKDLALGNKQEVQKIEDKIDQKKMENNFAFNNLPQNFPQQEETKSVIPGDNATNMKIQDNVPENLTVPPIKGENSSKSEQKNVKLKTGLEKPSDKIKNSDKKQKSIKKNLFRRRRKIYDPGVGSYQHGKGPGSGRRAQKNGA